MANVNDIIQYNLVNQKTKVTPNYDLSDRETTIQIYIDLKGNIVILGVVDSNYIYWASLTRTSDKEINEAIFNHIANNGYDIVSHNSKVLESVNISYEDLIHWHSSFFARDYNNKMGWKTPFGHYYAVDQIKNNGYFFANDVSQYLRSLQRLCEFRETNGDYEGILKSYYKKFTEDKGDYRYYELVKPLIDILEKEDYLRLSKNKEIRELYMKCMKETYRLYNQYMTAIR